MKKHLLTYLFKNTFFKICILNSFFAFNQIEVKNPPLMIYGGQYFFKIPNNDENVTYKLFGNNEKANGENDNLFLIPIRTNLDSTYTIKLFKYIRNDSVLIESKNFNVYSVPTPQMHLSTNKYNDNIKIHIDSITNLSKIVFDDEFVNIDNFKWFNFQTFVKIDCINKYFSSNGLVLKDDILQALSKLKNPSKVLFTISFQGSDQTKRVIQKEYTIQCLSSLEFEKLNNPYYEFYKNKNVAIVDESSFYKLDTIKIQSSKDLFIHFKNVNDESFRMYYFDRISPNKSLFFRKKIKEEKFLKMKNKKGIYLLKLYIENNFYDELIIEIY